MTDIEATYQSAMAEHQAGRLDVAETLYRQILERDRLFARAWHLLGVLMHQRGDTATGIEYIERAIGLEPQWPVFYSNLATIYVATGRLHQAEQALRAAVGLEPNNAALLVNLGRVLSEQNRCDEAVAWLQRALAANPNDAQALSGLGYAYSELGLVEESIAAYRQASASLPTARVLAATQLPLVYVSAADVLQWRERLVREVDALLAEGFTIDLAQHHATPVFSLAHQGFNDVGIQRKLTRLYRPPPVPPNAWQPRRGGKLRIGFISSYLNLHTIGKLARGLITRLPRDDSHVTVFSVGYYEDAIARELAASADRYVPLTRDLAAAQRVILANSVDILLYTDIGMDQTTYSLAFSRLAPVQCTTWGHPETTGLDTIDYFISSDLMEVPEADAHYTERLVRLPSLTFYYYRSELPAQLVGREVFGLDPNATLYACPQSIYKFHPDFDAALAGILRSDPRAKIVLIDWAYPQADALLRRRFAAVMPDVANRIVFIRRLQQPQFMNFLSLIDVMLDPFPYGGGNSSLEAFSFGVPVVTLPTEFLRGRITQAFCQRLGIPECIARDRTDYIRTALRLGTDREFRDDIRNKILARQPQLFRDEAAASDLAQFFHSVRIPHFGEERNFDAP